MTVWELRSSRLLRSQ